MSEHSISEALRKAAIAEAESSSIRALARQSGMDHRALARFIRGEHDIRLEFADRLAKTLGFTIKRTSKHRRSSTP